MEALKELVENTGICVDDDTNHDNSFPLQHVKDDREYNCRKLAYLPSWASMVSGSFMSKGMADKAATSGLTFQHFKLACLAQYGVGGIQSLIISELTPAGKPRVAENKSVMLNVAWAGCSLTIKLVTLIYIMLMYTYMNRMSKCGIGFWQMELVKIVTVCYELPWFAKVNTNNLFYFLSASEPYVQDMFSLSRLLYMSVISYYYYPISGRQWIVIKCCSL